MLKSPPVTHLTTAQLESALDHLRASPIDNGLLELIVRRPRVNKREVLTEAQLDLANGLVGDTWNVRGSYRTADGSSHPDMQLNIMNSRAVALVAQEKDRWPLAGDQLYIDLDLSDENLPAWTKLSIGAAIIQITDQPHTGCKKFLARFGRDAMKFVNSPIGKQLHLRGVNAKVIQPGTIRVGDVAQKI